MVHGPNIWWTFECMDKYLHRSLALIIPRPKTLWLEKVFESMATKEVQIDKSNRSQTLGNRRRLYSNIQSRARTGDDKSRNSMPAERIRSGRACTDHDFLFR